MSCKLKISTAVKFLFLYSLLAGTVSAMPSETISLSTPTKTFADIEVFVREGCPHCDKAKEFLSVLAMKRPDVRISIHDVTQDATALERLRALSQSHGSYGLSVPTFYLNGRLIIGFSNEFKTDQQILAELDRVGQPDKKAESKSNSCVAEAPVCEANQSRPKEPEIFEIELLGRKISLDRVGLPAFTVAMGLLDGFNPCSMWVLILMISLLAPMQNRWRMFTVAGTFVIVEGLAYFMFMAAWLNLFLFIGISRASEILIGLIAIFAGTINIKDFLAYGRGLSLSIPESAKPGIYAKIRAILQAENLKGAIICTVVLAVLVQIVEFLCTSGFPALYTRILTLRQLTGLGYYCYLLLYNAAYMLDDAVVLGIGIVTLSQRRLQEKEGRWLKLISGVVMAGLGYYLLIIQLQD